MYFTQLQTTVLGAIAGLISGGIVYVVGQTGLVPPFKTSPAVAFGGMTSMGAAIAALTYQACKVKKVEWGDTHQGTLPLSQQIEEEWDYIPHPSDELPPPIRSVDKPLPQNPVFVPQPVYADESPTHIQDLSQPINQSQPLIDNPFGMEEQEIKEWVTPSPQVTQPLQPPKTQVQEFDDLWGTEYQPTKGDGKEKKASTSPSPKTKTAFGDEFFL